MIDLYAFGFICAVDAAEVGGEDGHKGEQLQDVEDEKA